MTDIQMFDITGLDRLIRVLVERGFDTLGPIVRDGVVTYGPITSLADLPAGICDEQAPAHYRTRTGTHGRVFGFAAPVQSARAAFFPADELLWSHRLVRDADGRARPHIEPAAPPPRPLAYVGLRSCDLAAIGQHDRILARRNHIDEAYARRRRDAFLVAVTCSDPGGTCFCASLGTGPAAAEGAGADLVLTELAAPPHDSGEESPGPPRAWGEESPGPHRFVARADSPRGEEPSGHRFVARADSPRGEEPSGHRFVARADTPRGADLLAAIGALPVTPDDLAAAQQVAARAARAMGRALQTADLVDLLHGAADSPHWAEVAQRCLACSNCTLVCPTCFCTSVTDTADLSGEHAERHRVWASCFTSEHSYLHGGSVRASTASRYRQWLTHKLAAWQDQFDTIGCVGCGRCITWCPAGIDLTEEVSALRDLTKEDSALRDLTKADSALRDLTKEDSALRAVRDQGVPT